MPRYRGKLAADFIALFHAPWVFATLAALPLVVVDPDAKALALVLVIILV